LSRETQYRQHGKMIHAVQSRVVASLYHLAKTSSALDLTDDRCLCDWVECAVLLVETHAAEYRIERGSHAGTIQNPFVRKKLWCLAREERATEAFAVEMLGIGGVVLVGSSTNWALGIHGGHGRLSWTLW
jgi:hypothetical protein